MAHSNRYTAPWTGCFGEQHSCVCRAEVERCTGQEQKQVTCTAFSSPSSTRHGHDEHDDRDGDGAAAYAVVHPLPVRVVRARAAPDALVAEVRDARNL
jgi:hypothetical protein